VENADAGAADKIRERDESQSEPEDLNPEDPKVLRALGHFLEDRYPNPDRVGCPGTEVLKHLATAPFNVDPRVLNHIGRCAPCARELQELRKGLKHKQ